MIKYDKNSIESIVEFAKLLRWKSFTSFLPWDIKNWKGWNKWNLWQFLEKYYFEKKLDNKSEADFAEAWIELKATPIKRIKKWDIRSKERLVLNIINYINIIDEKWDNSTFVKKNSLILLVIYLYEEEKINIDYIIEIVELFSFKNIEEDYHIIKNDWLTIQNKIKEWKAHELSEWDTIYLWACTKWWAWWNPRPQPKSNIKAKQRAFSFKQWYMNYILKRIEWENPRYEKLFKTKKIEWFNFENELHKLFKSYIWKTAFEIWNNFDLVHKNQKNYYALLSNKIMWISNKNNIEEFTKANIVLKTIRIKPDGKLTEDISFPLFKSKELINQKWEDSDLYNMLESKKFFYVIFRMITKTMPEFKKLSKEEKNKAIVLDKVVLWNVPWKDIENKAKKTWEETIKIMKKWVTITPKVKKYKDWYKTDYYNDLPSKAETDMIHIRPHAPDATYRDLLPDWQTITKSCFWINADYIGKELGI